MGKVSGDEGWDGRGAVTILAWPLNDMVELFSDIRKHNPSEIVSIVVDSCNNTIIHLGVSWRYHHERSPLNFIEFHPIPADMYNCEVISYDFRFWVI